MRTLILRYSLFPLHPLSIITTHTLWYAYWGCVHEPAQRDTCEAGFCAGAEVEGIGWQNLSISAMQMECSEHHEPRKLRWSFMPLYRMSFEHLSWTGSSIPALASYLWCHVSPSSIDLWQDWAYHDRISGYARRGPSIP